MPAQCRCGGEQTGDGQGPQGTVFFHGQVLQGGQGAGLMVCGAMPHATGAMGNELGFPLAWLFDALLIQEQ